MCEDLTAAAKAYDEIATEYDKINMILSALAKKIHNDTRLCDDVKSQILSNQCEIHERVVTTSVSMKFSGLTATGGLASALVALSAELAECDINIEGLASFSSEPRAHDPRRN